MFQFVREEHLLCKKVRQMFLGKIVKFGIVKKNAHRTVKFSITEMPLYWSLWFSAGYDRK